MRDSAQFKSRVTASPPIADFSHVHSEVYLPEKETQKPREARIGWDMQAMLVAP